MIPLPSRHPSPLGGCAIRTHAVVEAACSVIDTLRDAEPPAGAPALPRRFLRHCDEHTVVAVRAVLECLGRLHGPPPADRCGVVAAPCQAGRITTAACLARLRAEGPTAVSPHVVPQCSLHSLAGAVSVALGTHGPHVGAGGGPDAVAEGLLAALTLLGDGAASGCEAVWLVATAWDAEPTLSGDGSPVDDPACRALAMLLVPEPADAGEWLRLSLHPSAGPAPRDAVSLADFAAAVGECAAGTVPAWSLACPWGHEIRLTPRTVPASHPMPHRRREAA